MAYADRWKQQRAARDHYLRNTAAIKKDAAAAKKRQIAYLSGYVRRVKDVPCLDCGRSYPHYVMDFDHVRGKKKMDVAVMVQSGVSIRTLRMEIAKCEIVCSNCHRERTWGRRQDESPSANDADQDVALTLFDSC